MMARARVIWRVTAGPLDRNPNQLRRKGLRKVIERSLAHALHGRLRRCLRRQKDHSNVRIGIPRRGEHVQSPAIGHLLVNEDGVVLVARDCLPRLFCSGSVEDDVFVLLQVGRQDLVHVRFVIDD